jgi:pimeloyl-ACP methyl ester carboxylesterase
MPEPVTIERGLVKTHTGYVHYRSAGRRDGPAILLCHINQQSSALYYELLQALSPHARLVAYDYPSHGHSDPIDWQPSINTYARCGIEVLDALGIKHVTPMGEAVGAAVSAEMACAFADRVERVVMVNCPYYPDRATAERNHAPMKTDMRPADPTGFPALRTIEFMLERDPTHSPNKPTQSWMDRINTAQIQAGRNRWQALDALKVHALNARLSEIKQPAMLLIGEHFHYARFKHNFEELMPRANVRILKGGRMCMTWERAEEIAGLAVEFMRRT